MKIFKTLFFVLLYLVGIFFAWSFGCTAGAATAMNDPELGAAAKVSWDGLFPNSINKKKGRRSRKHEKYVTLNEVLRGRDEFYDDVETSE